MKNLKKLLPVLILSFLTTPSIWAQNMDDVVIKAEKINDNLYTLFGRGGNIGVSVGEDGVFMVDDQYAPLSEKISAAIAEISDQPIKFLVNTHWHGDHTGGNENFAKKGAIIVAHQNVRERMSKDQLMKAFSRTVPASPEIARPVVTFTEEVDFHWNGEKIRVLYAGSGHTDGDTFIYFENSNAIHLGDCYFVGRFPFIDLSSGGSIKGIIGNVKKALEIVDDQTVIIPGHGPLSNKKELQEYHDVIQTIHDRMTEAIAAGKDFDQIMAADITKEWNDTWGTGFMKPEVFLNIVYTDLSRK